MASKQLNIFFHSIDGAGHLNACIGLAQSLKERGHRVSFLMAHSFQEQLETKFGFGFIPLGVEPPKQPEPESTESTAPPLRAVAQHLMSSGLLSGRSSIEKTIILGKSGFLEPFYTKISTVNAQMEQAIQDQKPDLVILDHILTPPAVLKSGLPYVLLLSGNPLMLFSPKLPPAFSGFPTSSDPSTWEDYAAQLKDNFQSITAEYQRKLNHEFGYSEPRSYNGSNYLEYKMSPFLNVYAMPAEYDYQNLVPEGFLEPEKYCQVDTFCRVEPEDGEKWDLPFQLELDQKLIYLSLGSMVGMDVDLMQRLVSIIGKTAHRCIVSKGPRGDEYELPPNCWGANFVPQTRILPLVDLVICHGGNNTVTEAFAEGKPMIVMPFLGDGYDNAARIHETGFGVRLEPYEFKEEEMLDAIQKLLGDEQLKGKLKTAAKRIADEKRKEKACERIEKLIK